MEEFLEREISAQRRERLRELFRQLDSHGNGFLNHFDMQRLGYVLTGSVPSFDETQFEIARVRRFYTARTRSLGIVEVNERERDRHGTDDTVGQFGDRLSWLEFLLFSRVLAKLPQEAFDALVDRCLRRLRAASPVIARQDANKARVLHLNRHQYIAEARMRRAGTTRLSTAQQTAPQ